MTKYEFLGDLSRFLSDLPEEERRQALHYYEDYFADAGEENEQDVLNELGSPAEIADQIKEENTENIFYDSTNGEQTGQKSSGIFARMDQSNLIIMILVLVVTSPIWGAAIVSIGGILLGIVSAVIGIFAALILGGGGSAIGGVVVIVTGIASMITGKMAGGILTTGAGCLLFSLGCAFCYLGIFLAARLFPFLWKQLQRLWDWCNAKLTGKEQS